MELILAGKTVHAATGGMAAASDAPALLFIHGAGMDGTIWSMQSRYFARHGHRVLALDLPDHGGSDGPPLTTIADMANWVTAVMDEAGIETAVLAGHSMGSFVALHLTSVFPDRVTGLALLGTAATMPIHPDLQAAADANLSLAPELITDWAFGPAMHRGGHPLPGYWAMGAGLALLMQTRAGVLSADLAACAAYDQAGELAATISCPVTFILGQNDRMTPPAQAKPLIDSLPHCTSVIIPDAGHMMMIEKPYETGRAVKSVLATS